MQAKRNHFFSASFIANLLLKQLKRLLCCSLAYCERE
jgi:hypothetical protein